MATTKPFWNRSTFLLITGASRGIGKYLAIKFSTLVKSDSTIVLLARNRQNLEAAKLQILASNPKLDVKIFSTDLSKPDLKEFDNILRICAGGKQYELYFLVHNAGYMLYDVRASEMDNLQQLNEYMTMNLYSVTTLTSAFLKLFTQNERCIVNISSDAAVHPCKGFVHYCMGKASREMYFKVLAEENPELNILNYSPGPIDTDLLRGTLNCWNEDAQKFFQRLIESSVKVEDTAQKLIETLEGRSYPNAEHIDFLNR